MNKNKYGPPNYTNNAIIESMLKNTCCKDPKKKIVHNY